LFAIGCTLLYVPLLAIKNWKRRIRNAHWKGGKWAPMAAL
jgi:hypothetical protein